MTQADRSFVARWSRWWPARPTDQAQPHVRCCACRVAGYAPALADTGWFSDRAGSWLCPECGAEYRRQAA